MEIGIFIFRLRPFTHKACNDTFVCAELSIFVIGIYGICSNSFNGDACQFLLIINTLLQSKTFVESFERVVFDKRYAIDLNVVDLGTELYTLVLLSTDNGAQIWAVDADNAVLHIFFSSGLAVGASPRLWQLYAYSALHSNI